MFKIEEAIIDVSIHDSAWVVLRDEKAIGYFQDKADAELFVQAKEQALFQSAFLLALPKAEVILSCGHLASEMVRNQFCGNSGIDCPTCDKACMEWDKQNA